MHRNGTFWINKDRNIAFFGIPKNSSTSIRNSIAPIKTCQLFNGGKDDLNDETLKITVIRDPFERFISGYLEVLRRREPSTVGKKFYTMKGGVERLAEYIEEVERGFFDLHNKPQSYFLKDDEGNFIDIDYYIIFENLNEDLENIKEETGVDISPKIEWSHPPVVKDIVRGLITDDMKVKILELYKEDVELYKRHNNE